MSSRMTSRATRSATSSPVSADGATQLDWLDILMIGNSGRDHAHVSPSALPESSKGRKTKGTSGRSSSISSAPDGPLLSWESRLRLRLERIGSTECTLTWKASATPAGRQLFRLVPSMRPINEIDFGLWPTATAVNRDRSEETLMKCAAFRKSNANQNSVPLYLSEAVRHGATMWPTPAARDYRSERATPEFLAKHWSHPRGKTLPMTVNAAMWPTPTSLAKAKGGNNEAGNSAGLVAIRAIGIGMEANGPSAQTEKPGALNPAFVCWLMGFPPEWESCAPTAMPSSHKSRQK